MEAGIADNVWTIQELIAWLVLCRVQGRLWAGRTSRLFRAHWKMRNSRH